jgi:hypothetical protein
MSFNGLRNAVVSGEVMKNEGFESSSGREDHESTIMLVASGSIVSTSFISTSSEAY